MSGTRVLEAERDFLLERMGYLDLQIAQTQMLEGAWTGSHGGHDPDFNKLKGGLKKFWIEKAAKSPHPFSYCVRHLRKHVANPERLCAWLKDQALGTTKWRKGNKNFRESDAPAWEPSIEELREALKAYEEAAEELGIIIEGDNSDGAAPEGDSANEGGSGDGVGSDGGDAGSEGAEAGNQGTPVVKVGDDTLPAGDAGIEGSEQPKE